MPRIRIYNFVDLKHVMNIVRDWGGVIVIILNVGIVFCVMKISLIKVRSTLRQFIKIRILIKYYVSNFGRYKDGSNR